MDLNFINESYCDILNFFFSEKEENQKHAKHLLNKASDSLSISTNQKFNNIITYGWMLSLLHENKYISIDTDYFLEDFDDYIYKVTILELAKKDFNIELLLDLINYLIVRFKDKNLNEKYYRNFIYSECIKLIINKLDCYIILCISEKKLTKEQIYNCSRILLKYSYCLRYINTKKTSESLINHIIFFIHYFNNKNNKTHLHYDEISFILLATINQKHTILFKKLYEIYKIYFSEKENIIFKKKLKSSINNISNQNLIFLLTNKYFKQ